MDPNIIIAELDAYCAAAGLKPTTVCQNALGDARLYDRLKRRSEKLRESADRLRRYMQANPAAGKTEAAE
ncbi:hypothetical protein [Haematobacter sp.]|uniref:Uncharacterized protein n=2 Tax=Paracoccaceae TaxID=31989 RepID=A0A212ABZ3_9RHOB|nr:hypothetical protein [Haematobacter sp.]OWJ78402.1 hypothetical protein CDV49_08165 [Haematobacter genomosp. 1]